MFVAFIPLHILLCDEVLLYFILQIVIIRNLNLNLIQTNLYSIKVWKLERNFFSLLFLPWTRPDPG
jgi:hypothetical protein